MGRKGTEGLFNTLVNQYQQKSVKIPIVLPISVGYGDHF